MSEQNAHQIAYEEIEGLVRTDFATTHRVLQITLGRLRRTAPEHRESCKFAWPYFNCVP
jgi:hypothetical protein